MQDTQKFQKLDICSDKKLNYLINLEKKLKNSYSAILKNMSIDKQTYEKICLVGSRPGESYGLAKVHKPTKNGLPPFRPILSAIGTPTYKLAKFLVPHLSKLTINEYTVKNSFSFFDEIILQNPNLYMASLDVDSLFTNIPLVMRL